MARASGLRQMHPAAFSVPGNRMYYVWKFVKNRGIILMLREDDKSELTKEY